MIFEKAKLSACAGRRAGIALARSLACVLPVALACVPAPAADVVPPPADAPAQVIVSGRTSTVDSIVIKDVGDSIPRTLAGIPMSDTYGFAWYVSQHYALKTDYDTDRAHLLLTQLELAYPHYEAFFGKEIAGIGQRRMAVIYGNTKESLGKALLSDGLNWDFGGGGITFERVKAAYNYPSGSLQYHQRYIMLHECTHLYQMCLTGTVEQTPHWFTEGIADYVSSHVWDPAHQRLTLCVVDKPTIHNWLDEGLQEFHDKPFTASDILAGTEQSRGAGFLMVAYLATDVDRRMKLQIWMDETLGWTGDSEVKKKSEALFQQLFGPPQELDASFAAWLQSVHNSYHYVDWGWEQDGNTLMSYGWPQTGVFSQTDLHFPPGEKPVRDPLMADYPQSPQSPLVGHVHRGRNRPVIGFLLGFRLNPRAGEAGMGLGVEGRSCLMVLVKASESLVIDDTGIGGQRKELALPQEFRSAMVGSDYQVGVTVAIDPSTLNVTLRSGPPGHVKSFQTSIPIDAAERKRLLSDPIAVLSRGGKHYITPYLDDGHMPGPNLDLAAPPNRWRNPAEPFLGDVYRSAWRLGKAASAALLALRGRMLAAATGDARQQARSLADYTRSRPAILVQIRTASAPADAIQAAIQDLQAPPAAPADTQRD